MAPKTNQWSLAIIRTYNYLFHSFCLLNISSESFQLLALV